MNTLTRLCALTLIGLSPPSFAMTDGVLLHPADGRSGLLFGTAVGISGDIAAVGAAFDANAGNGQAGSVFIYVRNGSSWTQETRLLASDDLVGDNLGSYVEVQDREVFAGAPPHIANSIKSGAVYVFARDDLGNWTQAQEILPDPQVANSRFGLRFAVQGTTLLVNGVDGNAHQVVFEFTKVAGAWVQTSTLLPMEGGAFGSHIALNGNVAVIGEASANNDAGVGSGVAYVFTRSNGQWSETARLQAGDGAASDQFGFSVSVYRDTAVVGAYLDDVGANANQGSAHVFQRGPSGWSEVATLTAPDGIGNDGFGKDLRICGDRIYVGASASAQGANSKQGAVYRWDRAGGSWTYTDKFTLPTPGRSNSYFGDHFGISPTALLVGAPFADQAYVYDQGCYVDAIFGDFEGAGFE